MNGARVMPGDTVRRPNQISSGGWWMLVTSASAKSFTGGWYRAGSTSARLLPSKQKWPQDGNYSRLSMVCEAL
jgi:hypothetical protein